jgi:hypothetical protein
LRRSFEWFNRSARRCSPSGRALAEPSYRRDLGDGLVLRWSSASDAAGIARVLGLVWRNHADEPLNPRVMEAAHRHMSGRFPLTGPGDFALVEDARAAGRPIVACTSLWREEWEYAGIPFGVGRALFPKAPAWVMTL